MDTVAPAKLEAVETGLDAFIAQRHARRVKAEGKDRPEEAAWRESERRFEAARRQRNRAAWFAYFCQQAQAHAALAADYERRAEELCEEGAA